MLKIYGETHTGLRRPHNEDAFAAQQFGPNQAVVVVADGVGGENGGEVASKIAVQTVIDACKRETHIDDQALELAIVAANNQIRLERDAKPQLARMGTTLVCAAFENHHVSIAHLGDSRAYRFRNKQLTQLTHDHTLAEDMKTQELEIAPAMQKRYSNVITRGLGMVEAPETEFTHDSAQAGDLYLLCSDGLSSYVSEENIKQGLAHTTPREIAQSLISLALDAGGPDNITVVMVKIQEE